MVDGRLRCLGTEQHLKKRYGRGYQLEVRLAELPVDVGRQMVSTVTGQPAPEVTTRRLCLALSRKVFYHRFGDSRPLTTTSDDSQRLLMRPLALAANGFVCPFEHSLFASSNDFKALQHLLPTLTSNSLPK